MVQTIGLIVCKFLWFTGLCIFCRKCPTYSSFTAWSWCNRWDNSHVCNVPDGYGSWKANCPGSFSYPKFVIARALLLIFVTLQIWVCAQTANSPYQYRGIAHALSTVLREEGPRALYRGWLPSVIGVVSLVFFFFHSIEFNTTNFYELMRAF